jgi:regulator of replication initiation timing
METNNSLNHEDTKKTASRRLLNLFIVLTIILALLNCFLIWKLTQKETIIKTETIVKERLVADKESLLDKLNEMNAQYDSLGSKYQGLDSMFNIEKERISIMITQLKKAKGSVAQYKKQVALLQQRQMEYIKQIEELTAKNQALTSENIKIKTALDSTLIESSKLSEKNTELSTKIQNAASLKAYEIIAFGLKVKNKGQEIQTPKAKKIEKIKVCFVIGENNIAPKGKKNVYLRIADPDGIILTKGTDDSYAFKYQGKMIIYSVKQEIIYNNKAMDMCLYWDKTKEFKKGTYNVDIFVDDNLIGSTMFVLE